MKIEILKQPYNPWQWVEQYQAECLSEQHDFGAAAVFVGTMRDFNEGDEVTGMTLEHYPEMTRKYLQQLAQHAIKQWGLIDLAIAHRVGDIEPGDSIVCVAVWSSHRKAAYEANRMIMEDLKSQAPFWKKERLKNGTRWVEKNTPGF
jgi:molybdopterin synthase catalytic subunit